MAAIVGRVTERAHIQRLLVQAAAGRSSALVLRGDAGIGKSALMADAAETAADGGLTVLRVSALQSAADVSFAALSELLRPHLGRLEGLPGPQAAALRAALGRGDTGQEDRFAAYAGVLGLLGVIAEPRPVLLVVDDAHWLDSASAEALLFAARRLDAEGVVMLFAALDHAGRGFPAPGLAELRLGGIDRDAAAALLAPAEVSPRVLDRLVEGTGGNPLALQEVARGLTHGQRRGAEPLPEPLPTAAALLDGIGARLAALPLESQRALLVAAASESGALAQVVPALRSLGLDPDALEEAEALGVIAIDETRLRFAHPLLRSAAYHGLDAADRRRAHLAFADTALPGDTERRAWHLAQAVTGPDERVALELERAAEEMGERTAYMAAAEAGMRAAVLSQDPDAACRRMAAAARNAFMGGDMDRALALTDELLSRPLAHHPRGEAHHLRGLVLLSRGPIGEAVGAFVQASDLLLGSDRAGASLSLVAAARAAILGDTVEHALRYARRALEVAPADRPDVSGLAGSMLLNCRMAAADPAWRELAAAAVPPVDPPVDYLETVVHTLMWMGEPERARHALNRILDPAVAAGAARTSVFALGDRALLRHWLGDWDAALADAHEADRLAAITGQHTVRVRALALIARIAAARGDEEICRLFAQDAIALGEELAMMPAAALAHSALGLLELGRGDPRAAVVHLDTTGARLRQMGIVNPSVVPYQGDLVEALLLSGDRERAGQEASRLAGQADRVGTGVARMLADRCMGRLVADDGVEEFFARALRNHAELPFPFPRARTELCLGERRLALGRGADARPPLESAVAAFRRLGAAPWAARAEAVLSASGARVGAHAVDRGVPLTHQELQVALLVAEGLSNKEVAARLFLSNKTVEFHLSNAYRKVGVRSRAELARHAAEGGLGRRPDAIPG